MRFLLLSVALGVGTATPIVPELAPRAATTAFCAVVTKVVTTLKQQSAATAYCSSFLSIPVVKTTVTVGGGVVTTTISSEATRTTTVTQSTCLVPSSAGTKHRRRGSGSKPKPGCLSKYSTGPLITSACKCLSIPASTSTITSQSGGGGSTVTVNLGTTSTAMSNVYARPNMAQIQVYASAPGNSDVDGHYLFGLYFGEQGQEDTQQFGFPSNRSCCASFSILDDGSLQQNGNPGGILYQNAGDPAVRSKGQTPLTDADVPVKCSYTGRADGTCPMSCSSVNGNNNNAAADVWRLNSQAGGFQLYALPR